MWPASRLGERVSITANLKDTGSCEQGTNMSVHSCVVDATTPGDGNRSLVLETLSTSPRVFRVASFLSKSELAQINNMVGLAPLKFSIWKPSMPGLLVCVTDLAHVGGSLGRGARVV